MDGLRHDRPSTFAAIEERFHKAPKAEAKASRQHELRFCCTTFTSDRPVSQRVNPTNSDSRI